MISLTFSLLATFIDFCAVKLFFILPIAASGQNGNGPEIFETPIIKKILFQSDLKFNF